MHGYLCTCSKYKEYKALKAQQAAMSIACLPFKYVPYFYASMDSLEYSDLAGIAYCIKYFGI